MKSKTGTASIYYNFLMIILILVSVRMIFYFAVTDFLVLITQIPDDASYYLKIAQNFNEGKGFSFDGISRTSGFQPLWQYFLILFTFVFRTSPEITLRVVMILQTIILFLSALIFVKILKKYFTEEIVFSGGLIYIIFVYFQYLNGMETPLMILIFMFLLYYILDSKVFIIHSSKKEFLTGILLGLLMLARLDTFFLAAVFFLFGVIKIITATGERRTGNVKCLLNILIGTMIIILPYLAFNLIYTGNVIPVSGYLKSTVPHSGLNENISELIQYREMFFGILSVIYLIIYFVNFRRYRVNAITTALSVIAAGNILLMIYILFFMNWVIFPWYFTSFSIFFSFFICLIFKFILSVNYLNSGKLIFKILSAFIILYWGIKIVKTYVYDDGQKSNWNAESYTASQWALNNTENSDLFAMKDAGHFSYFSRREVINLDGLVNSFEFQDILRDKKLNDYLREKSVKYIVQHAVWNRNDITEGSYDSLDINFISHKYSVLSDNITLLRKDEVYRSDPYFDGPYRTVFLIWKYQNSENKVDE